MRKFSVAMILGLALLGFSLMDVDSVMYFSENPMGLVFRPWWLGVEGYYSPYAPNFQYVAGFLRLDPGTVVIGAGGALLGNLVGGEYSHQIFVSAGGALKIPGIFAGFSVSGVYDLDSNNLTPNAPVPVVVGLGGSPRSEYYNQAKGGAGIYYLTDSLVSLGEGGISFNESFDYKNGYVGLYMDSVGKDGGVTMDVQFALAGMEDLDNALNYLNAQLTLNVGGLVIGGKFFGGFAPIIVGVAGIDLGIFRVYGDLYFDKDFNLQSWEAFARIQL